MKYLAIVLVALVMAACSNDSSAPALGGTYRSNDGKTTLVFKSDGKVSESLFGKDFETTYVVDGGKVKYKFSDGLEMTLKINSDGSLSSATGTTYVKQ